MLRYLIPLFPTASSYFTPLVYTLCLLAIIYSSLACLAQVDLKKIIAYSSIAHMSTATLGIFSNTYYGISSSVYFLISHGLISSALFLLIGVLYDRYHTRTINYYRGLVSIMPLFTTLFLIFSLANSAVPGTSGFISEFFTFIGVFYSNPFVAIFASLAIVLTPAYSLWFLHKIAFGTFSNYLPSLFSDITLKEFHLFFPLLFFTFFFGIYPQFVFEPIVLPCLSLLY
jgi:NADH:ubiquinone oxidoreductase subunit 4 (subunit M)